MQDTFAVVFLFVLGTAFLYNVFNPIPLIRITNWNNRLIRWNWPTEQDSSVMRILAGFGCIACIIGLFSFLNR